MTSGQLIPPLEHAFFFAVSDLIEVLWQNHVIFKALIKYD